MNIQIPIVILAAGESKRLGKPKQNLVVKGQTLLQKAIKNAQAITDEVWVVLGANKEQILPTILFDDCHILINELWPEGMASSIRLAVNHLQNSVAVLFMVCDQPYLETEVLCNLTELYTKHPQHIIGCKYTYQIGVPMIIPQHHFSDLLALQGDKGARVLVNKYAQEVLSIDFEKGAIDIDTIDDWVKLQKM